MKFVFSTLMTLGILTGTSASVIAEDTVPKPETKQELSAAESQFQEQMANSVLVGFFTLDDDQTQDRKPERYEIRGISKVDANTWLFKTRVKYGSIDTVVPLLIPIEWAGDTPMVSLTDFTIPGLGTFTCRVLFYEDRYAGTWQHGPKGGHMWGKIEKAEPTIKKDRAPSRARSNSDSRTE